MSVDVYGRAGAVTEVWGREAQSPAQITHEKAGGVLEKSLSNVHTLTIRRCGPLFQGLSFFNWAGTYVECPLHGRNLLREQDDIEGIHLRLREVYGTIPRIPAVYADVFRSSVRHCIIELRISQDTLVVGAGPRVRKK